MQQNIYLIGPMGVGKTTIGRILARGLHMEFMDSDQEIERQTGVSISTIFDIEGEAGFRRRETTALEALTLRRNMVLATGGGAVLADVNRRALRSTGFVVYLHASVDMQLKRTRSSKNRPLLDTEDPRATLEGLMEAREPIYRREADLVISTDDRSPAALARDLVREIRQKCAS
jgi:shikimate kinase